MLSTCDNQFFALKRLIFYTPKTGKIRHRQTTTPGAIIISLIVGSIVLLLTWGAIFFSINDQNLVFACLGLPTVIFPAVKRSVEMRRTNPADIGVPAVIYITLILIGVGEGGVPSLFVIAAAPVSLILGLAYSKFRA
jgi:hypothetical protein